MLSAPDIIEALRACSYGDREYIDLPETPCHECPLNVGYDYETGRRACTLQVGDYYTAANLINRGVRQLSEAILEIQHNLSDNAMEVLIWQVKEAEERNNN